MHSDLAAWLVRLDAARLVNLGPGGCSNGFRCMDVGTPLSSEFVSGMGLSASSPTVMS